MAQGNPRGKPASWAAVGIILVGFLVGGIGMVAGPIWWVFWVGVGIALAGMIFGAATGIMSDVH